MTGFKAMFDKYTKEAGKKQYLIPYFIAAHPGTTDEDMLNLALWLKRYKFKADQVQTFYPSPMATATAMYHTQRKSTQTGIATCGQATCGTQTAATQTSQGFSALPRSGKLGPPAGHPEKNGSP